MKTYWRLLFPLCALALCMQAGAARGRPAPRLAHVFVALADNANQGIVRVPAALGNGEDPARNLYWGASYGLRTYFRKSGVWKEIATTPNPNPYVLERSVFLHRASGTYLVADAYRGSEIKQAVSDFFRAAAGLDPKLDELEGKAGPAAASLPMKVNLAVYIGHDVLMEALALAEFTLKAKFHGADTEKREAIMLACASRQLFAPFLRPTGAQPLLWTTDLMAPEAYTLKAALDGWIAGETPEKIRNRAAAAYAKYQKISVNAAQRLFSTGW